MRAERVLLIGQAPSARGDPDRVLIGPGSGERIRNLAGLTLREYARRFERRNLLRSFPGKQGKGDAFPMAAARAAADRMLPDLRDRLVLLAGRKVAEAFGLQKLEWMEWRVVNVSIEEPEETCEVSVIPHPSGVSTWWNYPENRERARVFLRQLLAAAENRQPGKGIVT